MSNINYRSLAVDAFIEALPDDVYDKCPCGCDMKVKWAMKDTSFNHQEQFVTRFLNKMEETNQNK